MTSSWGFVSRARVMKMSLWLRQLETMKVWREERRMLDWACREA